MFNSSDKKGKLIINISDGEMIKGFNINNQNKKIYMLDHFFSKKKPSSLHISLKPTFTEFFVENNTQKRLSLTINLILNFKELHIIETGKKLNFSIIPRYKIESFCNSHENLFFFSNKSLIIVDLFTGEFLKKYFLGEDCSDSEFTSLTLSENGKYLFIQRNYILVLDLQKNYILKKVSISSQKFLSSKLFSKNQFLYFLEEGLVKLVNFNKNRFSNFFSFRLLYPALFSIKIKQIDGNLSTLVILTFGTIIQFILISSKKKLEIREPFLLNFKKKIESLGFLRSKKNLIIMFSGKHKSLPLKINFLNKKTRMSENLNIDQKTQIFFQKKEIKKHGKKKKNLKHLNYFFFRLLEDRLKTDFFSEREVYINYKISNWKKKVIKKLDNTVSWWLKNIPIFKSLNCMVDNLHFFQKKSVIKILYGLDYRWMKPFLNFILKNLTRTGFSRPNLLLWVKEIFFHHFLLMSDSKLLFKIIENSEKHRKKYFADKNFLDISVFLTMMVIQSENFSNKLEQPCIEMFI